MHSLNSFIHPVADFLHQHLQSIAIGLAATLLVIYGASINGFFRRQTRSLHFFLRFGLFILLCSVGYAFLTSVVVKFFHSFLNNLSDLDLVVAVVSSFLVLGFLARAGKDV